jgi:phosphatidylserine decarboxylase
MVRFRKLLSALERSKASSAISRSTFPSTSPARGKASMSFSSGNFVKALEIFLKQIKLSGLLLRLATLLLRGLIPRSAFPWRALHWLQVSARLCPVDYHRYHYPDSGQTLDSYSLHGKLHSVSPIALHAKPDVLITNERRVAILQTEHFGKIAYVEIGALNVGRIVQSHSEATAFKRGQEKGYFLFGGSSAVILGEPGRWKLDPAMLERSLQGIETWVALGTPLAERAPWASRADSPCIAP